MFVKRAISSCGNLDYLLFASGYGPSVGGLFLAFPAIFPSGAGLIENHEKEEEGKGWYGRCCARPGRGWCRLGGSVDWMYRAYRLRSDSVRGIPAHNAYGVILSATLTRMLVSTSLWAGS
jgi:hypothetical protein